nr:hypothetical protein [uncultured Sphingomonas sp.]
MGRAVDERRIFWGILLAAVIVRLFAFNPWSSHHPDELIQYLEQAHRIVFGYGVVPWEFRYFIRSWLIPLMLVPPMQIGEWIDPGGQLYLVLPRLMVAAINFGPVIAGWYIGRRFSLQHAIIAMVVMAFWVECVAFSVQTLSESMAVSLFLIAAAILKPDARFRNIMIAGALIAIAGIMRFQFGPAMAAFGIMVARKDWRIWKGLLAGGLPVLVAGGLLDLAMGLWPYQWVYTNYAMNIAGGKMRMIAGPGNPLMYAAMWVWSWQLAFLLVPFLAIVGWRRYPALMVAALVNLAFHQLVDHKEYRYIWLTVEIMLLLAALGSVDLLKSTLLGRKLKDPGGADATVGLAVAWIAVSAALAITPVHRDGFRIENDPARLASKALHSPAVCGIAVPRYTYWQFGYALLHVDKPVFLISSAGTPRTSAPGASAAGYNSMLIWSDDAPPPAPWRKLGCTGTGKERSCLMMRPGGCEMTKAAHDELYQQVLYRFDM